MATSKLTAFQHEVLAAFFERERRFFLTGGAALAGFHLGHRTTEDLDLFTLEQAAFERSLLVTTDVAAAVDAVPEVRKDVPGFKSVVLRRRAQSVVVDLALDMCVQLYPAKLERGHMLIDPEDEILANKLKTLRVVLARRSRRIIGPPEERDLVDVMLLERAGHPVEAALPPALAKDAGCTPATLVRLLSEVEVPDGIELPAAVPPAQLRPYLADLIRRLQIEAADQ